MPKERYFMKIRMIKKEAFDRLSKDREEVLHKNRGYGVLYVECHGATFAVPLRSNMNHSNGFKTVFNGGVWNGVDYSKALVVSADDFDDEAFKPRRTDEYDKIQKNKAKIQSEFELYIQEYVEFIQSGSKDVPMKFKFSTLKYFHKELGLE